MSRRRVVQQAVMSGVARAAIRLPRWVAGRPIVREGRTLDGQVQIALALRKLVRLASIGDESVKRARRELELQAHVFAPRHPPMARIENLRIDGPGGPIPIRVYWPAGVAAPSPALVYLHGGGWVLGSLRTHAASCQSLAADARCVVIAVDYRLAPEHPFPAAPDDALAAFRHVMREAGALDLDASRIAVGGDSAGGNLAAVVALETRTDALRPCFQLLIYPAVDLTMSFPSVRSLGRGFFLEKEDMDATRGRYLRSPADARDPRASPWFASDLSGAPAACVLTAGFDPLRDEGDAYAKRLRDAGVAVSHRCYDSLFHGFFGATGAIRATREPYEDAISALRNAFAA